MKRILVLAVVILLGGLLVTASWWAPRVHELARIGTGYGAKQMCSAVFVSGRDPEAIRATDLADLPGIVSTRVDHEAGRVTARAGWVRRAAKHRPGLGCTLESENFHAMSLPRGIDYRPHRFPQAAPDDPLRRALVPVIESALGEPQARHRERGTRAVVVLHRGRIVGERYAPGFDAGMPLPGWSIAKSATNALAGVLVEYGTVNLDDPVPGWEENEESEDYRSAVTLRHLLQMTSGLDVGEDYTDFFSDPVRMLFSLTDTADFARRQGVAHEPGTHWAYTSATTNLLMWALRQRIDDETAWAGFPRQALFAPLGMKSAVMEPDPAGTFVGSSFMFATARDWARLGQLYLQDGVWNGERILPEGWVDFSRAPAPQAPKGRYGAHFWTNHGDPENGERPWPALPADAYAGSGFQGQEVVIVPSRELVVVRLGLSRPGAWDREWFSGAIIDVIDEVDPIDQALVNP